MITFLLDNGVSPWRAALAAMLFGALVAAGVVYVVRSGRGR